MEKPSAPVRGRSIKLKPILGGTASKTEGSCRACVRLKFLR